MRQVTIERKKADGMPDFRSPEALRLLEAIEASRKAPVKVYTTDVSSPNGRRYTISTGSKDVHLELGRMGREARVAMVKLIDHETSARNDPSLMDHEKAPACSELLLIFKQEGFARGLICTKQALPDKPVSITLQVAND